MQKVKEISQACKNHKYEKFWERRILFRVWDKRNKKWVKKSIPEKGVMSGNCFFDFEEFTGLKDKNGKEIYEGEILSNIIIAVMAKIKY